MVTLEDLYQCIPVYISHPILGFTFTLLKIRAALFKKLFIFFFLFISVQSHFNKLQKTLLCFSRSEWLRYLPPKFRQGSASSTRRDIDMEPIRWFQAHRTSELITAVSLLANASSSSGASSASLPVWPEQKYWVTRPQDLHYGWSPVLQPSLGTSLPLQFGNADRLHTEGTELAPG